MWHEGMENDSAGGLWPGAAGLVLLLGFVTMMALGSVVGDGHGQGDQAAVATFIGLLLHAAADGLAVGVSSAMGGGAAAARAQGAILLAIMLHKVPAALALGSKLLLRPGQRSMCSSGGLMVAAFACASPLSAVLAFVVSVLAARGSSTADADAGESSAWMGLAFLFAGGTFLHVAVSHMDGHDGHAGAASQHSLPQSTPAGTALDAGERAGLLSADEEQVGDAPPAPTGPSRSAPPRQPWLHSPIVPTALGLLLPVVAAAAAGEHAHGHEH